MSFVSTVLFSSTLLVVVSCHEFSSGQCPQFTPVDNFDWSQVENYFMMISWENICSLWELTEHGSLRDNSRPDPRVSSTSSQLMRTERGRLRRTSSLPSEEHLPSGSRRSTPALWHQPRLQASCSWDILSASEDPPASLCWTLTTPAPPWCASAATSTCSSDEVTRGRAPSSRDHLLRMPTSLTRSLLCLTLSLLEPATLLRRLTRCRTLQKYEKKTLNS